MSHLHEQLDDLVEAPSRQVRVDPAAAWAGGVRRRRRRTALAGAGAALAVVLVVLVATSGWLTPDRIEPAGRDGRPGVTGYPDRVEAPWWVRDLPARPGPLAGLVELESGEWRGVSASGRQWGLPDNRDVSPALSTDGTMLALAPDDGPFELRDLVSGVVLRFDEISAATTTSYSLALQQPVVWSPDGSEVAARGGQGRRDGVVLIGLDRSVALVPSPPGAAYFVGWAGADRLAWLSNNSYPLYTETDESGTVLRTVPISAVNAGMSQWDAGLSPDRRTIAIAADGTVSTYDLATGRATGRSSSVSGAAGPCPITWLGRSAVVSSFADVLAGRVRTDPRLGEITCSIWATDAIAAGPQRSLTDRLPWRWREIGAGALGALVLLAGAAVRRRRRTGRAPGPAWGDRPRRTGR